MFQVIIRRVVRLASRGRCLPKKLRSKTIVDGANSSWTQISGDIAQIKLRIPFVWNGKIGTNGWLISESVKVDSLLFVIQGETWGTGLEILNVVGLYYVAESPQAHTKSCFSVFAFKFQAVFLYYFGLMSISTYWLSQITSIRSWVLLPVLRTQFLFSPCRFKAFKARRLTGAKVSGVRIPSSWGMRGC